jgi:hypothetical protein
MITRHTRPQTVAPHINIVPAPVVPPFPAHTPHGRRSSIWTAGLRKRDDELSYPGIPPFTHRPGRLGQQEAGRRMVRRGEPPVRLLYCTYRPCSGCGRAREEPDHPGGGIDRSGSRLFVVYPAAAILNLRGEAR